MPTKIKVLVGWMLFSMAILGANALINNQMGDLFSMGLTLLIMIGVLKGSEGIRTMLIIGSYCGIALAGFGVLGLLTVMPKVMKVAPLTFFIAFGIVVVSLGQNIFTAWCLTRIDVQDWMLKRSLGEA